MELRCYDGNAILAEQPYPAGRCLNLSGQMGKFLSAGPETNCLVFISFEPLFEISRTRLIRLVMRALHHFQPGEQLPQSRIDFRLIRLEFTSDHTRV